MKTLRDDNRGAALVYVLLTVTLAAILGTGLMMLIVNRVRMLAVDEAKAKEYYLADGAMELVRKNDVSSIAIFLELGAQGNPGSDDLSNTEKDWNQGGPKALCYYITDDSNPSTPIEYKVIYFGEKYRTEIVCVDGVSYEVTQTPREGGDGRS